MSLVIGIKCTDGIIVGADSSATLGSLRADTIRQKARKIHVLENQVLFGVAGTVGLTQRYVGVLTELLNQSADKNFLSLPTHRLMACLHEQFFATTKETFDSLELAKRFSELAVLTGTAGSVLALKCSGELTLLSFDQVCNPEMATQELPFACVGIGRHIADPFLGYIKRIIWGESQPNMAQGALALSWTMQHTISLHPGGVGGPYHVYQMTLNADQDAVVTEMHPNDIQSMENRISDLEAEIRDLANKAHQESSPPPTITSVPSKRKR